MSSPSSSRSWPASALPRLGLALVALLALAPLATGDQHLLAVGVVTLMYAYLALSWNVVGGIAGQLSLGHAAYFGIGAYTSTWLFVKLGVSPWLGLFAGAALSALAALLIGAASLRLRGAYFALATIASCAVLRVLVDNADSLLGGPRGMGVTLLRDAPWQFQHTHKAFYYGIGLVLVAFGLAVNHRILSGRFGFWLAAVRNDDDAALALGVPTIRCKLAASMISAAMTAVGGTFYAQFVLFISPDKVFGADLSVVIAVSCIIGGRATLWGPVLGAVLLQVGEEIAREAGGGLIGVDMMLYGLLLMVVTRIEPRGLVPLIKRWRGRRIHAPADGRTGEAAR